MIRRPLFLLLLLLWGFNIPASGQIGGIREADSLKVELNHVRSDLHRAEILNHLSAIYLNINPPKGIAYAREALSLSEKIGFREGKAEAWLNLGASTMVSNMAGNREEALKWFNMARQISEESRYKKGLGRVFFWESVYYLNTSDYARCLESANNALTIFGDMENCIDLVAVYDVLSILYFQIKDVKKGEEMALKGLDLADRCRSFVFKPEILYQYGYYVRLIGNKDPQGALGYYNQALDLSTSMGLNTYASTTLGYIAHIYSQKKDYPAAINYYLKSIDLEERNEINFSKGWSIYNIGFLYLKMARDSVYMNKITTTEGKQIRDQYLKQAVIWSEKALKSARERSERDYILYIYYVMSEACRLMGDYQTARDYYKLTRQMNDSITSQENQRELTRVETNLLKAVQNKDLQIKRRALTNNILIIVFLSLIIMGIGFTAVLLIRDQRKSNVLLLNILPPAIAHRLRNKEKPIVDYFDQVSVIFIELIDFADIQTRLQPELLVGFLNRIFTEFDRLTMKFGLDKIKTVGSVYIAAAGLSARDRDHALDAAAFTLEATAALSSLVQSGDGHGMKFRCGIDCGPVVAGVIGEKKFIYDIWGNTVNLAARMEQLCEPGKIQVTDRFRFTAENQAENISAKEAGCRHLDLQFTPRGTVQVKGKGPMETWFLERPNPPEVNSR